MNAALDRSTFRSRRSLTSVLLLCLLLTLTSLSCSTYSDKAGKMRAGLEVGDPATALIELEKIGDPEGLPYFMERGLLEYLTGDLTGCQTSLSEAETVIEDLYTKSLSKEALTMILNDSMQDYQGEIFERLWVHFYRALAYIAAGEFSEAAVEGRSITFDARRFSDQGEEEAKYRNDPFLQLFAGWLYEADGAVNDAWINYRDAERLYRAEDVYGVETPEGIYTDLIRAGRRLGFTDEVKPYLGDHPRAEASPADADNGEVVLLVSTGLMPLKVSNRIDFPIFKDNDQDRDNYAMVASEGYRHWSTRRHDNLSSEVDYILSIALPEVPLPAGRPPRAVWDAVGRSGELEIGANLGAIEKQCLDDRYKGVVIRTLVRALTKYWSKEKLEEKNKAVGFLADIMGSATEVADTRCWSSLPAHVHFARISLPAGRQTINVRTGAQSLHGEVEVKPGRLSFLHLRAY
ncbi:MAG: hypothetical protein GY835_25810 [bacterium]|nr:hypothetical protein [bacterium]